MNWLEEIKAQHSGLTTATLDEDGPIRFCYPCDVPWPCEKSRLIARIEKLEKEKAQLQFRLHWAKIYMDCASCREIDDDKLCVVHDRKYHQIPIEAKEGK